MAKKTSGKDKYILGIDSGATSSDAVLFPLSSGKMRIAFKKYPAINYNVLGFGESLNRLIYIIIDSSKKTGLKNIAYITAGISGARYEKDRVKLAEAISKKLNIHNIKILPDTETAFYSVFAHNQTNCGILIAGTGSVLYYKGIAGKMNRIGGWGRIIGDEGSGYWIAKEALSAAVKYYDRSTRPLRIALMLNKKFGLNGKNIIEEIYHKNFELSKITKHIFRLAEKGDLTSAAIIKNAARHLAELLERLGKTEFTIALCGSLFTEEKLLEKYLLKISKKKFPNISFIKPRQKPVWGAVEIAKNLL